MKILAFSLGLSVLGMAQVGSFTQVVAEGGWNTRLVLLNTAAAATQGQISFLGDPGTNLSLPTKYVQSGITATASSLSPTLNAYATWMADTAGLSGNPTQSGWAQLSGSSGISGYGIFSYPSAQWNAAVPIETRDANSYVLAFDNTGALATGVALANIAVSATNVQVILRDDTGNRVAADTINLASQGHTSFMLNARYPITAGKRGTIQFQTSASGQISVLGLRANGPALTTLPALSNADSPGGSIAHVTYNGGFTSTFYLVNTGISSAPFTLSFLDESGNPLTAPLSLPQSRTVVSTSAFTQTLDAGAMLEIDTQARDALALVQGSAQLMTTGSISGFEIFRWTPFGQEASVPLETRAPGSFALVFDNTGAFTTGVALSTASRSPVAVTAIFRDDTGALLGSSQTITLPASGHTSFMLPDQFPVTTGKRGMVEFVNPPGGVSIIGLRATSSGTLTTIPMLAMASSNSTGVPGVPISLVVTPGDTTASIAFTAPASNGGSPIVGYIATCTGGGVAVTTAGIASPLLVTGLSNETAYLCTVAASNANGTGSLSAAAAVIPTSGTTPPSSSITLTSTAGQNGGLLPAAYTCDGTGSTLPLAWSNAPAGTSEFAVLMSTVPAPGTIKYDWVLYHIPGTTTALAKDSFLVGTLGVGDDGPGTVYDPPCSQGPGAKVYTFTVYALSASPTFAVLASQVTGELVASAISPITLGSASLSLSYSRDPSTAPGSSTNCTYIRNSTAVVKSGATSVGCDGTYAYVGSIGLPIGSTSDPMMNGITSTNLQIPTPTDFQGANGWKIPLHPVINPAGPTSVVSGPIGVAINGVPIFDACVQNGCSATSGDTKALGQLDICNGHSGRADDYHYHAAPNCLMAEQSTNYWNTHPIGWALDGFAIFGYNSADGSPASRDNICGGNTDPVLNAPLGYSYHVIDTFPYISNNCLTGVPSPDLPNQGSKFHPMRPPPVTPFNNTNMTLTTDPLDGYQVLQFTSATAFTTTETGSTSYPNPPGTYKIRYKQVTGAALDALLALKQNSNATACWNFQFVDNNGNTTQPSVSYCKTNP